jgi:hypothetical protein
MDFCNTERFELVYGTLYYFKVSISSRSSLLLFWGEPNLIYENSILDFRVKVIIECSLLVKLMGGIRKGQIMKFCGIRTRLSKYFCFAENFVFINYSILMSFSRETRLKRSDAPSIEIGRTLNQCKLLRFPWKDFSISNYEVSKEELFSRNLC